MSETTPGETPVERRLREMAAQVRHDHANEDSVGAADIDAGREALALLRVFQAGPSGEAWDEWLANVRALLARCEGDR